MQKIKKSFNKIILLQAIFLVNSQLTSAAEATHWECNQAIKAGQYAKAIEIADAILKSKPKEYATLTCKARAHGQLDQNKEALLAASQADQFATSAEQHLQALALLGDIQKNSTQLNEALSSFQQVLTLSQQTANKRFERIAHNKIGDVFMLQQEPKQALTHFLLGEALSLNANEHADNFERIAASHDALQQYDIATEFELKAVNAIEGLGDPERLANAYLMLGRLYTQIKSYSAAENTLNKLIKMAQEYQNTYYQAKAQLALARTKQAAGDTQSAQALKQSAIQIATQINAQDLLKEAQSSK